MSDQDAAIASQSDFFRNLPLIYAIFEVFLREQTSFFYRHSLSGKGLNRWIDGLLSERSTEHEVKTGQRGMSSRSYERARF